jgi:hypothetical protein
MGKKGSHRSPVSPRPSGTSSDPDTEWTLMVYMVGDPELQSSIDRDLLELERAGPNDQVEIIVAVQRNSAAPVEWFELISQSDGPRPRKAQKTSQQPTTAAHNLAARLTEFLKFVAAKHRAKHYLLILWGHASGLEFGRFEPGSELDRVGLRQLAQSLAEFKAAPGGPIGNLDILGFCACAVSKAEFAVELRGEVDFLVSSQVAISTLMTWPFDEIANLVIARPSVRPATLAGQIVQCFEEFYEPPPVALTALDLNESEELRKQIDGLADSILGALDAPNDLGLLNNLCVLAAFKKALAAYPYDFEPLVDFYDLCRKLVEEDALQDSVRKRAGAILDAGFRRIVVSNARSGPKLGALHGLSILAPDLDDPDLSTIIADCAKSTAWLWRETRWVEVVRRVRDFASSRSELV